MNYKTTYSRHRDLWLVVNKTTNSVHSWWDTEAKASATTMDLNRWEALAKGNQAQALKDALPSNVIPFRPKGIKKVV